MRREFRAGNVNVGDDCHCGGATEMKKEIARRITVL